MARIQPGDLDLARELWRDYYRLPGSAALRTAAFGTAPVPLATAPAAQGGQADRGRESN
jgi:hypothetical protein